MNENGITADATAKASRDTALLYIQRVTDVYGTSDISDIPRASAAYQLRRLDTEFGRFQSAQTSMIAIAEDDKAKKPLMDQLFKVDEMYRALFEKFTPLVTEDPDQTRLFVHNQVPLEERSRKPIEGLSDFDGTHQKWPAFRDLFRALVIDAGVSKLQCLLLLRKHCKGASEQMLEGYELVEASFEMAWTYLKEIYEDTYSIIQSLIDRLVDMEPASGKVPMDTRRVVDTMRSTLRQLNGMKVPTDKWDALMINLAARKMPPAIIREWEKERKVGVTPTFDELLLFIDARSRLRLFNPPVKNTNRPEASARHNENKMGGEAFRPGKPHFKPFGAPATSSGPPPGRSVSCFKCEGQHFLRACPDILAITNLKARETELLKYVKCTNCLAKSHVTNECGFPACKACNGVKHHYVLCPKDKQQKRDGPVIHHTTSEPKRHRGNSNNRMQ